MEKVNLPGFSKMVADQRNHTYDQIIRVVARLDKYNVWVLTESTGAVGTEGPRPFQY